ncbi:isopenicillin N synthase family dioxygenase [Pedobacter heparinus]|uniref:2OG-Fe(II) oxygenase n=1 Tax=Pedobacter heparinus (strain ATCC 13125 / DSM 2366 / CIP 104194 / JCM 7457 / NBRC 12017 / NCIMB 9290 / NRRL B-14731 / HIM 762-3) TaxID=485917 RepID=C6Y006_PEDHD|nr:2-oxoglutarate and iron-dependent oxygenase domain-containing protein [Pedobacter heparinus]ACU02701.1 2OG-Fe(II) oxygenase [Pedobacter heparinus DSM 2366]
MSTPYIPCLDLGSYIDGNEAQRKKFSDELGRAFNDSGFVTITNHGLDQELIDKLYQNIQAAFRLSPEQKEKYEKAELAGQRGYTSPGKETAKGAKTADLKEFWQIGQEVEDGDPIKEQYPDNEYLEEIPGFNEVTREIYQRLESNGKHLLRAIATYLNLPVDYFDKHVHNGNSILRGIHYFPIENPDLLPDDAVRAGAHEDINLITLLIGASADGLEVLTRSNEWLPIKAHHTDIVVNVGDMLQRLTNNKLKSTTHRVVNPPRELMKTSRFSVPFFLHPRSDMDLTSLESCIDAAHPKVYEDMTAGEYLDERLREIGLKK